ncbi:MAG: UvrD-helicase domain-containing protein [Bacteroidia bacterium]
MFQPSLLTIYNASAGSGKTTTLIKEILKIILELDRPDIEEINTKKIRQILGLTFTNAVANELKNRLLKVLYHTAFNSNEFQKYKDVYYKNININDTTIIERAKFVLFYILHNYSDVSLQTIDSFSNKVLKSFAYELQYPIAYEISNNTDVYYSKALDNYLDVIQSENDERLKLIVGYIKNQKKENTEKYKLNQLIQEIIEHFKPLVEKESGYYAEIEMRENIKKINEERIREIYQKHNQILRQQINAFNEKIREILRPIPVNPDGTTPNPGIDSRKKGIQKLYQNGFIHYEKEVIKNHNEEKLSFYKKGYEKQDQELMKQLLTCQDEYKRVKALSDKLEIPSMLLDKLVITKFALELVEILNALKKEDDVVFFSDFTKEISKVVQSEDNVDFIFEKVGTRYRHFLIDEFQDTSTLQFHNLLPLIHNAMSQGNENFIVGDPKQSIYRWRNANVQQFVDLYNNQDISFEKLKNDWEKFKPNIHTLSLNNNYRSNKTIVEFNNKIFHQLKLENSPIIEKVYEDAYQLPDNEKEGLVKITVYNAKDEFSTKEHREKQFAEDTFNIINQCLQSGYKQKDICIILRTNREIAHLVQMLRGRQTDTGEELQFISPEGLKIYLSDDVQFIVSFLQLLTNTNKKIASGICHNYVKKQNFQYDDEYKEDFIEQYKNDEQFKLLLSDTSVFRQDLYQLCLNIVAYFNVPFNAYVHKFLYIVNEFIHQNAKSGNTLEDFINFWEKYKESFTISVSKEQNAVKIMTIHKSKGLEFPIVITNINYDINDNQYWYRLPNDYSIEIDKDKISDFGGNHFYLSTNEISKIDKEYAQQILAREYLEDINTIYVAFTRAIERMYIFTDTNCEYYKKIIKDKITDATMEESKNCLIHIFRYGQETKKQDQDNNNTNSLSQTISLDDKFYLNNNPYVLLANAENLYTSDKINFGIKVHKTLEYLQNSDIQYAIKKALAKGIIRKSETEKVQNILESLINNEHLKQYLSDHQYVLSEPEFFDEQNYRPDKIIFTKDNQIVLLEFKTGKKQEKHKKQVCNYIQLASKIYHLPVRAFLIYLNENACEVLEVSEQPDDVI